MQSTVVRTQPFARLKFYGGALDHDGNVCVGVLLYEFGAVIGAVLTCMPHQHVWSLLEIQSVMRTMRTGSGWSAFVRSGNTGNTGSDLSFFLSFCL